MKEAKSIREILDLLHIDRIGREIESVHDMIRESYTLKAYVASDYEDFKSIVCDYYSYHDYHWHNGAGQLTKEMAYDRVRDVLDNQPNTGLARIKGILDSEGSYNVAAKNSLTGRGGGLKAVLDNISEQMKKKAVTQWVSTVFLEKISPLNSQLKVSLMVEYLELYGGVLIPDEELLSPYDLASNLEFVVQNHVRQVNEFRKTLQ